MRKIAVLLALTLVFCAACSKKETASEDSKPAQQTDVAEKEEKKDENEATSDSKDEEVTEDNFRDFPVTDESVFSTDPVEGGVQISSCKRDIQDKVVVVPGSINGQTVVAIGQGAFVEAENVEAIVLPDSVASVGTSAFTSCPNLKFVYFGSGLKETGDKMFNICNSIEKIELPEGTERIGGYLSISCPSLKVIVIPESVTEISKRIVMSSEFNGVVKTPAGSFAETKALEDGLNVENY